MKRSRDVYDKQDKEILKQLKAIKSEADKLLEEASSISADQVNPIIIEGISKYQQCFTRLDSLKVVNSDEVATEAFSTIFNYATLCGLSDDQSYVLLADFLYKRTLSFLYCEEENFDPNTLKENIAKTKQSMLKLLQTHLFLRLPNNSEIDLLAMNTQFTSTSRFAPIPIPDASFLDEKNDSPNKAQQLKSTIETKKRKTKKENRADEEVKEILKKEIKDFSYASATSKMGVFSQTSETSENMSLLEITMN